MHTSLFRPYQARWRPFLFGSLGGATRLARIATSPFLVWVPPWMSGAYTFCYQEISSGENSNRSDQTDSIFSQRFFCSSQVLKTLRTSSRIEDVVVLGNGRSCELQASVGIASTWWSLGAGILLGMAGIDSVRFLRGVLQACVSIARTWCTDSHVNWPNIKRCRVLSYQNDSNLLPVTACQYDLLYMTPERINRNHRSTRQLWIIFS